MSFIQSDTKSPVKLKLGRNLVRSIKRGHPWIFAEAVRKQPQAPAGSQAILFDKRDREIARGFYDPNSPLIFRVCSTEPGEKLDDQWALSRLKRALALRWLWFDDSTTGYRLLNGEGDGLPGLICDLYEDTAVLQLDGAGPQGFWDIRGIADWLQQTLSVNCVYERPQSREDRVGQSIIGHLPEQPITFLENGITFTVDVREGQKTGFYLDQRNNRQRIRKLTPPGGRVLNLFGYTGGFSVYAGLNGAEHVTTVDLAEPALETAKTHWDLNDLPSQAHQVIKADAFEFLETAIQKKQRWGMIIMDPPSFASSKQSVAGALASYQKLIAAGASVTLPDGFLAVASCSSHIRRNDFLTVCEEGISKAWRRATLLGVFGQPIDHPTPLVFSEFRYLKFVLLRVE